MLPELLKIGPLTVSSYGILLVLAILVGVRAGLRRAALRGLPVSEVASLSFISVVSGLVGARLLYVVTHLREFQGRWMSTFLPSDAGGQLGVTGVVLLGGVVAAVLSGVIYLRRRRLEVLKFADVFSAPLALGIFFGRIGCFLNGCCFGKACSAAWAVEFPPDSPAGTVMGSLPLHPTQLYSAIIALVIWMVLHALENRRRPDGFLAAVFLVLFGAGRFFVDFFRVYEREMMVFASVNLNQLLSLALVILGAGLMLRCLRRSGEVTRVINA